MSTLLDRKEVRARTIEYYSHFCCAEIDALSPGVHFICSLERDARLRGFGCRYGVYVLVKNGLTAAAYAPRYAPQMETLRGCGTEQIIRALEKEYRLKKLRLLVFGGETVSDFGAVRLLTAADYPLYEAFFRSAYPGASPEGWLEEYFLEKAENGLFAGAEQDGRLVSVCDAPDMPYMEGLIQHTGIMTPEGYRRRGFARACCALETHHLLTLGICPQWECAADNEASYRLARSIGYEDYASAYIVED